MCQKREPHGRTSRKHRGSRETVRSPCEPPPALTPVLAQRAHGGAGPVAPAKGQSCLQIHGPQFLAQKRCPQTPQGFVEALICLTRQCL